MGFVKYDAVDPLHLLLHTGLLHIASTVHSVPSADDM